MPRLSRSRFGLPPCVAGACSLAVWSAADAVSVRTIVLHDASGIRLVTGTSAAPETPRMARARAGGEGLLWHLFDPNSITHRVVIADATDETWVGHDLNDHRLSYFRSAGDGVPIFEFSVAPENPSFVGVASAEDTSLGVVLVQRTGGGASVRGFREEDGSEPLWIYEFAANYDFNNVRNVDVSADGSIVIAASRNTSAGTSLVVILDGDSGQERNRLVVGAGLLGVELDDSGARAVLTEMATARIIETDDMTTLFSFAVSGAGGFHRISRNGRVVAAGGFNYRVFGEGDGKDGWRSIRAGTEPNHWFGNGIALSENGDTLFLASHNFATGIVDLTYRVIDLATGEELARTTTHGKTGLQDTIQVAQSSADGSVFAIASWGTIDDVHPEVQVFDRDLNLIGGIDTPGSPFDLDLTRDGRLMAVGSKHIHANDFGRGSDTYTYRVRPADCPADLDGDGTVAFGDILAILTSWGNVGGPEDLDGNGVVDFADLLIVLAAWGPCP